MNSLKDYNKNIVSATRQVWDIDGQLCTLFIFADEVKYAGVIAQVKVIKKETSFFIFSTCLFSISILNFDLSIITLIGLRFANYKS